MAHIPTPPATTCITLTLIDSAETTAFHDEQFRLHGDDVHLLVECGTIPSAVDYLHAR